MKYSIFLFPGQGSQYSYMGTELSHKLGISSDFIRKKLTPFFSLQELDLFFTGQLEEITPTYLAQPFITAYSLFCWDFINSKNSLDFTFQKLLSLGHSIGEYACLYSVGALSWEEALRLAKKRGQIMQECYPVGQGGMSAILSCEKRDLEKVCQEVSALGEEYFISIANINSPQQFVVAGNKKGLEKISEMAKAILNQTLKIIPLKVSAPFHCKLMEKAKENFFPFLKEISFSSPIFPYIPNVTGTLFYKDTSPSSIGNLLSEQITANVLWAPSFETIRSYLEEQKISLEDVSFFEIGPGNVLTGLLKRNLSGAIGKNFDSYNFSGV